jgi:hypothetical protein
MYFSKILTSSNLTSVYSFFLLMMVNCLNQISQTYSSSLAVLKAYLNLK